ncbi:MAG: Ig-like domain-containing protein [Longimicrobiales bacterium]
MTLKVEVNSRDNLEDQKILDRLSTFSLFLTSTAPGVAAVSSPILHMPGSPDFLPLKGTDAPGNAYVEMQVTGVSPGVAIIEAIHAANIPFGEPPGRARVTVLGNLLVGIDPTPATIRIGDSQQYVCTVRDAATGAVLPNQEFDWSTSNSSVASVDQNGRALGLDIGTSAIRCQIKGRQFGADAVLNVISNNRAPTAVITVPVNGAVFNAGELVTFLGQASDPEDGALTGAALAWSLGSTVFGNGNAVSRTFPPGLHTIRLTATDSRGAIGTTNVTINVVPVQFPQLNVIGGTYSLSGTKRTDTCAPGTFPATISNPGPIAVVIGSPNLLRLQSTALVSGPYDQVTGTWTGVGQTTIPTPPSILRETITGNWRMGPPINLTGQILNEILFTSGTKLCEALYDVTYLKTN